MPKDIRIEIKPRNNLILTRMEEKGIRSIAHLCREAGLERSAEQAVNKIVNLRSSPLRKVKGKKRLMEWRECVLEVARALEATPEELFPESIRGVKIMRDMKVFAEVSVQDLQRLGGNTPKQLMVDTDPEKGLLLQEFDEALGTALQTLTPREEKILKVRFGLEDGQERTADEVAQMFAVPRSRIHQIEAKALRKMRHPSRSQRIRQTAIGAGLLSND